MTVVLDAHAEPFKRGEPSEVAQRLIGDDGVTRWVHMRVVPRRVGDRIVTSGVASDVTGRRQAEERLREAEEGMRRSDEALRRQAEEISRNAVVVARGAAPALRLVS